MFRVSYIVSFVFLLLLPASVLADEKIIVNPAFQEISLEVNQRIQGEIEIENQTSTNQLFTVRSVDFSSLDNSGGVAFLGSDINNNTLPSPSYLSFETNTLEVAAGERKKFTFAIQDAESLAPGGHYAALVFQSLPVTDDDAYQKIAVRQIFSSLIFLEKKGGERKELNLKNLSAKPFYWVSPKNLEIVFENSGNTHVVPRGVVQIRDIFGKTESCAALNEASGLLLPGQERAFPVTLRCQNFIIGPATLLVQYRYDGKDNMTQSETSFFVLPYQFFLISAGILLLVFLIRKRVFPLGKKSSTL